MNLRVLGLLLLCACITLVCKWGYADASPDVLFHVEKPSAKDLLQGVLRLLPSEPHRITGELMVRRRRGIPSATYLFTMDSHWGGTPPETIYHVYDDKGHLLESLTMQHDALPSFDHRVGGSSEAGELASLSTTIQSTDISWMDLTLAFLWWDNARHEKTSEVSGFACYVLHLDAPPDHKGPYDSVRLWVDKTHGMMLRAEGYDHHGNLKRELWVRSAKRIDDETWMIKDLEVQTPPGTQRTRLHIAKVEQTVL